MITLENGLFLLLQAFSSGVAGYITNKYAVNMIFKEYTPLKIGGAVKKNKEKFIEEISDSLKNSLPTSCMAILKSSPNTLFLKVSEFIISLSTKSLISSIDRKSVV